MYVFTKHGLAAFAGYRWWSKNAPGWLDDHVREAIHDEAANGEPHYLVRGWHPQLIADLIGPDQTVFSDDDADYQYRGLIRWQDMPGVIQNQVDQVNYRSLKSAVHNALDNHYYMGLAATHETAKFHMDKRVGKSPYWIGGARAWSDDLDLDWVAATNAASNWLADLEDEDA